MIYIFDFDNVLFHTTKYFKKHMFLTLEKVGITKYDVEEYYKKTPQKHFSLKKLLNHFSVKESLYEKIMSKSKNFTNTELLEIIKKIGKTNCYIVTFGDKEFQLDKITRTGIASLFLEIIVVPNGKKETIEKICIKHKNEKVIFIDDKAEHFKDLDFKKCFNLKTILYDENGLEKLKAEIK